jgi:hypothetical protein
MGHKVKVQICFAKDANLEKVKEQLVKLNSENDFEYYCCFLPRNVVEEKKFDTKIVDMLDEVLGDKLIYMTKDFGDFDNIMKSWPAIRTITANIVNRLFVLDSGCAAGVGAEIELFTNAKVILL